MLTCYFQSQWQSTKVLISGGQTTELQHLKQSIDTCGQNVHNYK